MALLPPTLSGHRGGARSSSFPAGVRGDGTANPATPDLRAGLRGVGMRSGVRDPRACLQGVCPDQGHLGGTLAPSSSEAATAESRAPAPLRQGLRSSLQQLCFGERQGWGGENQASVHFSLLTRWQPLSE